MMRLALHGSSNVCFAFDMLSLAMFRFDVDTAQTTTTTTTTTAPEEFLGSLGFSLKFEAH